MGDRHVRLPIFLACLTVFCVALTPVAETADVQLRGVGSTLVRPVVRIAARIYGKKNGVRIKVLGGGTTRGIEIVGEDRADFGMTSRALREEELQRYPDLESHTIGFDGVAVITHRANPVGAMSRDQVRKVFTGAIQSWQELGGADGGILPIAQDSGRASHEEFVNYFGLESQTRPDGIHFRLSGETKFGEKAVEVTGPDRLAIARVGKTENAIAFVSVASAETAETTFGTIKRIVLDGSPATLVAVKDGSYPIIQPLNILTAGGPTGHVKGLIEYLLSDHGQKIVRNMGYIPAR